MSHGSLDMDESTIDDARLEPDYGEIGHNFCLGPYLYLCLCVHDRLKILGSKSVRGGGLGPYLLTNYPPPQLRPSTPEALNTCGLGCACESETDAMFL